MQRGRARVDGHGVPARRRPPRTPLRTAHATDRSSASPSAGRRRPRRSRPRRCPGGRTARSLHSCIPLHALDRASSRAPHDSRHRRQNPTSPARIPAPYATCMVAKRTARECQQYPVPTGAAASEASDRRQTVAAAAPRSYAAHERRSGHSQAAMREGGERSARRPAARTAGRHLPRMLLQHADFPVAVLEALPPQPASVPRCSSGRGCGRAGCVRRRAQPVAVFVVLIAHQLLVEQADALTPLAATPREARCRPTAPVGVVKAASPTPNGELVATATAAPNAPSPVAVIRPPTLSARLRESAATHSLT